MPQLRLGLTGKTYALPVWYLLGLLVVAPGFVTGEEPIQSGKLQFNRDIRPVLSDKCFQCHGPDQADRQAELRLDREDDAKRDRGGYRVIDEADWSASELVSRIASTDPDTRMPPGDSGKKLSDEEIARLKQWVQNGAPWSDHWAYVMPATRDQLPKVRRSSWPHHWIDHYLLAGMEAAGQSPAADAEPHTLVRRLYFDLIGLPPTPAEVDEFGSSHDASSYERLIDRLLASDHFGERLAVYWLDLVRYADTVGYHGDQDHHISPYRDYVIESLNANISFAQFTREQLAGDLLPDATIDQRIATGYNRLLQTSHEGGVQPKEYLAIYGADRVRNVSAVWLGATMGCAQCHDHKYDPYTTKDFYAFQAFFADVDEAQHFKVGNDAVPTRRPPELSVLSGRDRARLSALQQAIDELSAQSESPARDARMRELEAEREAVEKRARKTMVTVAIEPRTIRVLPRGNWLDDSGSAVDPAVPEFMGSMGVAGRRPTRLDLANWLTDPEHGIGKLTARVFVNRMWYLFFGSGIARDLEDFGGQGQPPDHPELLDRLAVEFVAHDWNIKWLIKQMVMSHAYRQSSTVSEDVRRSDPENRLFARQGRFRLPAELVRDNVLAVGGLLVLDFGGRPVKPYQPAGYFRHLNFPKRSYRHDQQDEQWRRGVYVHWQRQFLHPTFKALDAPRREECTAERPRSNTPLAALALLNDPTFVEAARGLAERVLRDSKLNDAERLDGLFRWAVSRTPDDYERSVLLKLLHDNRGIYESDEAAALEAISVGLRAADETLVPAELASWAAVARAVLNLGETNTRQ